MADKLNLRQDVRIDKKWAHPGVLGGINWSIPGLLDGFFEMAEKDPQTNIEERIEQRAQILKNYLDNESEKKKARGDWRFEKAPGCVEEPETEVDICVRVPKNLETDEKLPCIIEVPGGGLYIAGSYEYYMPVLDALAKHHKAVVVSLSYRTCVEAMYPAAVNDCHATYQWILDHAEELNVDTDKIIVHGFSSGAQLALCLGFRLKRYGIKPRGIVASLPIIDDVNANQSGSFSFHNPETDSVEAWDAEGIRLTMQKWLGEHYGDPALLPDALPSRATVEDCIGFPPVWIPIIGEMDGSRDATLDFCAKLHKANVFVDYHVWGGCNHNSTDPSTGVGAFMAAGDDYCIDQAIEIDFSRPWTEK